MQLRTKTKKVKAETGEDLEGSNFGGLNPIRELSLATQGLCSPFAEVDGLGDAVAGEAAEEN